MLPNYVVSQFILFIFIIVRQRVVFKGKTNFKEYVNYYNITIQLLMFV